MIPIAYAIFCFTVCFLIFGWAPMVGGLMIKLILSSTAIFAVTTIIVSIVMSLSVTFYQSLKSAMLSTILVGISAIFVFQMLAKTPTMMMLIIPLGLVSIYVAIKNTTHVTESAVIILGISNITALYIAYKMTGFALKIS